MIIDIIVLLKFKYIWFDWYISNKIKVIEAIIIGIDNIIEKIADDSLFIPKILAPVIVTPALLAPGIKANDWHKPIKKHFKKLISDHFLFEMEYLSAKNNIIANKIFE